MNFLAKVPAFLRQPPLTIAEAQRRIASDLETRDVRFLEVVRRGVFGHERSPYLPLLKLAQCELPDLQSSVASRGIEGTLHDLRAAGVYVSFEEFKGRIPLVREGRTFDVSPASFDNPLLQTGFIRATGGSTGRAVPIRTSLADIEERAAPSLLGYAGHGVAGAPTASGWDPPAGIGIMLCDARYGQRHLKWFAAHNDWDRRAATRFRMFWLPIVVASRAAGNPLPFPRRASDVAASLARWAGSYASARRPCVLRTSVSLALRTVAAAERLGLAMDEVRFVGGGEPPTPGKVRRIEATGARWVPTYTAMETSKVGMGCGDRTDGSDVHLLRNYAALITHPRVVPGAEPAVESFHFTTVRFGAPKLLLNVELDDYGTIEERSCGCPLGDAGLTTHLRDIFSFSKLTGEGVTFVGSDMVHIVDDVLPGRFGGSSLDYQFVEEEDQSGYTKLTLVVSERVGAVDEPDVVDAVLSNLGESNLASHVRSIWGRAGTVRIRRGEPQQTGRGKVLPLLKSRRPGA